MVINDAENELLLVGRAFNKLFSDVSLVLDHRTAITDANCSKNVNILGIFIFVTKNVYKPIDRAELNSALQDPLVVVNKLSKCLASSDIRISSSLESLFHHQVNPLRGVELTWSVLFNCVPNRSVAHLKHLSKVVSECEVSKVIQTSREG